MALLLYPTPILVYSVTSAYIQKRLALSNINFIKTRKKAKGVRMLSVFFLFALRDSAVECSSKLHVELSVITLLCAVSSERCSYWLLPQLTAFAILF